jgi:hypothetical protein
MTTDSSAVLRCHGAFSPRMARVVFTHVVFTAPVFATVGIGHSSLLAGP